MDDVIHKNIFIPSNWKKEITYSDGYTSTEPLKNKDASCDPMQRTSVGVQTDPIQSMSSDANVKIQEQTVQVIINILEENIKLGSLFERLNIFHDTNNVRLEALRTYNLQLLEAEPHGIVGMVCGSAGRVAILIGEQYHSSWCGHQAKIVISQRSQITSFPQAVCPTSASWSPQGLLAVGSISGEISIYSTEKLITFNTDQTRPLTSINWYSASRIVTCNTEGQISSWHFKGTSLEHENDITLSVSNLPRRIRKTSPSNKPLAIVAMQRYKNELLVASETGGLWTITLPDFQIKAIPSEPRAIQYICHSPPHIAIADDFSSVTILATDGSIIENINILARWLFSCAEMLVISDGTKLIFYDPAQQKIIFDEKLPVLALAASNTYAELVILTRTHEIITYNVVRD